MIFTAAAALAPTLPMRDAAALSEVGALFSRQAVAKGEPLQRELLARLITHKLQREHDLLALDGRSRYAQFCSRHPLLARRIPLLHLASYLGLTDVSLSRIRRSRGDESAAD